MAWSLRLRGWIASQKLHEVSSQQERCHPRMCIQPEITHAELRKRAPPINALGEGTLQNHGRKRTQAGGPLTLINAVLGTHCTALIAHLLQKCSCWK